jgi:hypothetical protein
MKIADSQMANRMNAVLSLCNCRTIQMLHPCVCYDAKSSVLIRYSAALSAVINASAPIASCPPWKRIPGCKNGNKPFSSLFVELG